MIREIRVQNYKSIRNSGWVDIDEIFTTLVGGNEAGKTNFLESITLLGDSRTIDDGELCDYKNSELMSKNKENIVLLEAKIPISYLYSEIGTPRRNRTIYRGRKNAKIRHKRQYSERELIEESIDGGDRIAIARRYADGTHRLEFRGEGQDARRYLQSAISDRVEELRYKITVRQLSMDLDKKASNLNEHPKDSSQHNARIEDFLSKLDSVKTYLIENREIITESFEESQEGKAASKLITEVVGMIDSYHEKNDVILYESDLDIFPHIHSFNNIDEIGDESEINKLEDDPNTSLSYYSLLQFSDLEPSELSDLDSGQIRDRRQKAGRELTQTFDKYWDQSDIEIKMELSGGRVSLHLYDESNVRKQPSDRSTGLRWFLSFLARVITQSKGELLDSIILLDDPGVHLHPNGHKDLRKALRRLAEDNQVIYSTHSPYMIDTANISRIRVVEREEQKMGTKVKRIGQKDTTSDDSLAPVRASLGATFSDSLFSSKYTILVEGFEDRVYLNRFSELFRRTNEGPFFDADMKIIDCGGASKTDYMSRLVNAENYEYAVLLDSDSSGKQAEETLLEEEIPEERITMISNCIDEEGDKTIEDLFSEEFFCEVVSEVHNMEKEVVLESLSDNPKPLVKRVDGALKQIAEVEDAEGMILDKRSVAKKINKGISEGEYDIQDLDNDTLRNFELIVRTIIESLNLGSEEEEITSARMYN